MGLYLPGTSTQYSNPQLEKRIINIEKKININERNINDLQSDSSEVRNQVFGKYEENAIELKDLSKTYSEQNRKSNKKNMFKWPMIISIIIISLVLNFKLIQKAIFLF